MMTADELPERFRGLYRAGDPLPTWGNPHIVNTWQWPRYRRKHFERYIRGEYLGCMEEIADDAAPTLEALPAFDHPRLKRLTDRTTERDADHWATITTAKACAGLNPDLRTTGLEFRRKIREDGVLTRREAYAFQWTLSAIRNEHRYTLVAKWRLSIYEIARLSATSFDGLLLAKWLNLWSANPDKPIPEGDDLTDEERARARGYIVTPIDVFDASTLRQIEIVHHRPDPGHASAQVRRNTRTIDANARSQSGSTQQGT